jgi:phosphoglycerate dehydrogenase-like enzyme
VANDPTYQDRLYSMEIKPEHVASADAIMTCRPYVRATAFANGAGNLVAVARAGIGYDKIDLEACTANDVVVFNTPHGMTHSTAAAAMLFILALSKRFPMQERILREHRWDLQRQAVGDDLAGMTLGIIGLGKSGLELVRLIAPFRMRVIAYSPHADPAKARESNVELKASMDEVLKESDYLSLHGRLDEKTRGMLGERELGLMKPSAYFVNVARGEMVDEHVLIRFLRERRIAGAGLDVYEFEPLPVDSPLLKLDNVILTPHWLCSTRQAGRASALSLMQDILRVAHGELPDHILNPQVTGRPGFLKKLKRFHSEAAG